MGQNINVKTGLYQFYDIGMKQAIEKLNFLQTRDSRSFLVNSSGKTKDEIIAYIDEVHALKSVLQEHLTTIRETLSTHISGHEEADQAIATQINKKG